MPRFRPEDVVRILAQHVGFGTGARIVPTWRSWRWMVDLPGDGIVWIAEDDAGWTRLQREAGLIATLAASGCQVPIVTGVDETARLQVRSKLPGICGQAIEDMVFGKGARLSPAARYRDDSPLTEAGRMLSRDLGTEIAVLHRVPVDAVRNLGLGSSSYLTILDQIDCQVVHDALLQDFKPAIPRLRDWFAALPEDPVIALGDLQMHNMAVDVSTGALVGVFDFDDAAVAHRLEDFKYLLSFGVAFTQAALEAYSAAGGPRLSLHDVSQFHVLSALEHLTFVDHASPRGAEVIDWTAAAISRFLA